MLQALFVKTNNLCNSVSHAEVEAPTWVGTCAVFLPPRSDSMEVPNNSTGVHYFSLLTKLNIRTRDLTRSGHAKSSVVCDFVGLFLMKISLCLIPKWAMKFTHIIAITILNKPDRFYKSSWPVGSVPNLFSSASCCSRSLLGCHQYGGMRVFLRQSRDDPAWSGYGSKPWIDDDRCSSP